MKGRANVWTQDEVQQSFQIDVQKIEELFCQNERQGDAKPGRTKSQLRETKEQVGWRFRPDVFGDGGRSH